MKIVKMLPVAAAVVLFSIDPLSAGKDTASRLRLSGTSEFESVRSETMQKMYLLYDSAILSDTSNVSSAIAEQSAGSTVSVLSMDGSLCKVLTSAGSVGYIELNKLTDRCEYVFANADEIKYAAEGTVLKTMPFSASSDAQTLDENEEIHLTGTNDFIYQRCEVDGTVYYVDREDLMNEMIVEPEEPEETYDTQSSSSSASYSEESLVNYTWDGQVLNPVIGVVYGPSGKETYYNLPMEGVVQIMRDAGYTDEYWVRSDGCKMFGDYIMVAADQSIRPLGTLVETSLGTGIVCDTGTFIYNNPTQIDIAVTW